MANKPTPLHMDRWSRTERLYRYLLGLGLIVDPFYSGDDQSKIEYLQVAVDLSPFQHRGGHPNSRWWCSGAAASWRYHRNRRARRGWDSGRIPIQTL